MVYPTNHSSITFLFKDLTLLNHFWMMIQVCFPSWDRGHKSTLFLVYFQKSFLDKRDGTSVWCMPFHHTESWLHCWVSFLSKYNSYRSPSRLPWEWPQYTFDSWELPVGTLTNSRWTLSPYYQLLAPHQIPNSYLQLSHSFPMLAWSSQSSMVSDASTSRVIVLPMINKVGLFRDRKIL